MQRNHFTNIFTYTTVFIVFVSSPSELSVEAAKKSHFVQPLNMGLQMSLPYDLANIYKRANSATLATILAGSLAFILFFGVITSPFGYMFGIPSRKYVLGAKDAPASTSRLIHSGDITSFTIAAAHDEFEFHRLFDNNSSDSTNFKSTHYNKSINVNRDVNLEFVPTFEESMFYFMPNENDEDCKELALCYAHGFLQHVPSKIIKIYQKLFSRKLFDVPSQYQTAIISGISNKSSCFEVFEKRCPKNVYSIILSTFSDFLPKWSRNRSFKKY